MLKADCAPVKASNHSERLCLMQGVLFSWQSRAFPVKENWCRLLCLSPPRFSPRSISAGGKGFTPLYLTAFWFHLSFIAPWDEMESKMMSPFLSFPSLLPHRDSLLCFHLPLPPPPFPHPITSAVTCLHGSLFSIFTSVLLRWQLLWAHRLARTK